MSNCIACDFISPKHASSITFIGGTSGIFTGESSMSSQVTTTQIDIVGSVNGFTTTVGGVATLFSDLNLVNYYLESFTFDTTGDSENSAVLILDFNANPNYWLTNAQTIKSPPTFTVNVNSDPALGYVGINTTDVLYQVGIYYYFDAISFTPGDVITIPEICFTYPSVNYVS
jgi:hypothetical protein